MIQANEISIDSTATPSAEAESLVKGLRPQDSWRGKYIKTLRRVDAGVVALALATAHVARFGLENAHLGIGDPRIPYWLGGLILGTAWWAMLGAFDSRKAQVIGSGPEEFKLVFTATSWLFGLVAITSFALELEAARLYLLMALPIGGCGVMLARWILRKVLHHRRRHGQAVARVLVVGGPEAAAHVTKSLSRHPEAGLLPVAEYIPKATATSTLRTGEEAAYDDGTGPTVTDILKSISACDADTVAMSSGVLMSPLEIRKLGWSLAEHQIRLIMAPALTDIAGPRIHVQPVAGLPLVHVSTPHLSSGSWAAKRAFDFLSALLLIVALSPVFLVLAAIVRGDGGPILYRQKRVGLHGTTFTMFKFRSMVIDADQRLNGLSSLSIGSGVMFKMKNDPRITPAGRWMRRFSLDELPQLFNVVIGDMSLVGPRPPLLSEVASYEEHVHRRLLVKPGITGLWQVSGRSDLSWEDTVRLDLYYVENWSLSGDLIILLKTVNVVLTANGAY